MKKPSFVISPCPCCGSTKTRLTTTADVQFLAPSIGVFDLVHCPANEDGCGTTSGWYDTPEEAIAGWSKRIPRKVPSEDGGVSAVTCAVAGVVMFLLAVAFVYFRLV